jgi:WD40 repeat protein/serine/threonine protein kinase
MTDLDLSRRKLGEFVLREPIGAGGYGTVYRAEQPALRREAVVKVLRPRWRNDAAPERFLREARLASRLDHPYAAHVYSFGVEDDDEGLRWIAMELVHGLTLAEWLRSRGPMPLARFVPFFECVAQVVHAAHTRGIVHRDLKPSNIMVLESEGQLFPKLLDFGVAKLLEEPDPPDEDPEDGGAHNPADAVATVRIRAAPPLDRTNPGADRGSGRLTPQGGAVVGSVAYMSPEQWHDPGNVGPATDLYSLGCVAYEALTGRTPFMAETPGGYYELHCHAEPPPLGDRLPPGVEQALRRALAKPPDARHASALELAAELRAVLRAEPREQLRVSALQWHDRGRPAALLWHDDLLAALEQWMQRSARTGPLTALELAFVDASKERALDELQARERRAKRVRRAAGAAAVTAILLVFFGFQVLAAWRTQRAQLDTQQAQLETRLAQQRERDAQRLASATATVAELEQGRAALLHDEMEDAQRHLSAAWQRGDHSSTTAFMLARALQPRLAELARFSAISRRMWWTAWSPDGQRIVTTDDGGVQIWDAHRYRLLFRMPSDSVYSAAYSADSTRLLTAGLDGVYVWNAATGALVRELRRSGQRLRFQLVAVSPDGRRAAVVDGTGAVTDLWDIDTGAQVTELHNDAAGTPSLAFSPDGRWLATSGGDRIQIVDTTSWQPVSIPVRRVLSLSFDPTGPRIAIATAGGGASVWMLPSGALTHHLRELGEPIDQIAWSPDGRLIATASRDGAELVWDARSAALVSQGNHLHDRISSIEFDSTSKLVLAAGRRVIVSDAAQGIALASLDGPQRVARFAPNDRWIVGASPAGTARLWDSNSSYRRWAAASIADTCGVFSGAEPDQRYLPIACPGHPTRVWDTAYDRLLAELPSVSAPGGDFALALPVVDSNGTRAAIARGNTAEIYELPGGRLVRTIMHGAAVSALAFGPGGALVSGDVAGGSLLSRNGDLQALPPARGGIDAIVVLADGRTVAADATKHLRVVDRAGGLIVDLQTSERVGLLRPSPDARRLVIVPSSTVPSRNGAIDPAQLWDLEAGRLVAQLAGHVGRTFSVRWTSDDEILTAGSDGTARSWDGVTGQQRQLYRGGGRFLADAVRTGELVIAGDGNGGLHFWDSASGGPLWTLRGHRSYVAGLHFEGSDLVTRDFGGGISRWSLPSASKIIEDAARRGIVVP